MNPFNMAKMMGTSSLECSAARRRRARRRAMLACLSVGGTGELADTMPTLADLSRSSLRPQPDRGGIYARAIRGQ